MAQTKDHAPVGLTSAEELEQDKEGSESWTYMEPGLDLSKYRKVIVERAFVYDGPDAQFDGIEPAERAKIAEIFTTALGSELAGPFPAPAKAGADTLRLRVTILGAKKTKGGVATATRLTTFGLATNAVKSAAGKPGTMTGSVLFALEAFDGKTGELVAAGVRRRSPDALDITATLSTTDTVKAVARDFAENIRKRLEKSGK
ncbi:MAG TPA: DUF3313 domain-containing protein [Sphingomicrobium sp.]|nr:DUF3313 domain-containing protein [Sphingomicrobium sp.]